MPDDALTDPKEIARYVESASELYVHILMEAAVEIPDPPVVVKTATGARVMAWLPIEDEDVTA